MQYAIVFGWGAVEHLGMKVWGGTRVQEVEIRLWYVYDADDRVIGVIGKAPRSEDYVARVAADLSAK